MTGAIEKLTLYAPVIASSGVFAMRRAGRGIDALDDNPVFGAANLVISGGQLFKGARAAKLLTMKNGTYSSAEAIESMNNTVKGLSTTSKFLKLTGKVLEFTSRYINPLICGASFLKVIGSDDKADTAVREIFGCGTMFAFEGMAKRLIGMPIIKYTAKGAMDSIPRTALYTKIPQINNLVANFEKYCQKTNLFNKIPLKSLPSALKGALFVLASIAGYKFGNVIANGLIGKKENQDKI